MISKAKLKHLQSLKLKKYRQKYDLFIAEGDKIVNTLINQKQYQIVEIIASSEWLSVNRSVMPSTEISEAPLIQLESISTLKTAPEVIAVVKMPNDMEVKLSELSSAIYLDEVQDPGNVGTIIRIADWYGVAAVIRSSDSADFYNAKVIQSSMGSFANVSLFTMSQEEIIRSKGSMHLICSHLDGKPIDEIERPLNPLLIMGNEGSGVSQILADRSETLVYVPGAPDKLADSLNVSVSAGILAHHFFGIRS